MMVTFGEGNGHMAFVEEKHMGNQYTDIRYNDRN